MPRLRRAPDMSNAALIARPAPHLEEQAKLHAAVVLQVVALAQRLVHGGHAQREGLARHRGDVGGWRSCKEGHQGSELRSARGERGEQNLEV